MSQHTVFHSDQEVNDGCVDSDAMSDCLLLDHFASLGILNVHGISNADFTLSICPFNIIVVIIGRTLEAVQALERKIDEDLTSPLLADSKL